MTEYEFDDLALYNAERARGIMHTPEWQAKMAHRQSIFDWHQRSAAGIEHGPPPPPVPLVYKLPASEKLGTVTDDAPFWAQLVVGAVVAFVAAAIMYVILQ